uniref:Uncharacterized protein n=1 Tax=Anguilla anguilla TaxID=7936 RepID=A0A0E9WPA1_ANGAN
MISGRWTLECPLCQESETNTSTACKYRRWMLLTMANTPVLYKVNAIRGPSKFT